MIKQFSKNKLFLFDLIFKFPFIKKQQIPHVKSYEQEINTSISRFTNKLNSKVFLTNHLEKRKLTELYSTAIYFRCNKKLMKNLIWNVLLKLMFLVVITIPILTPKILDLEISLWEYIIIYISTMITSTILGSIILSIAEYIQNFKVKIGNSMTRLFKAVIIGIIISQIMFIADLNSNLIKAILVSVYGVFCTVVFSSILRIVISETIVDAFYFSKKILITDELILEASFRLATTNWNISLRKRTSKQTAINEVERLANLLENDWSNHIKTGDDRTHRWKSKTLSGIASSIRKLKRQIIIPSTDTASKLNEKFNSLFDNLLKHDLKGMIDDEVVASRFRSKSKSKIFQSILVASLPLSVTLCLKYFAKDFINEQTLHVSIVISGIWLLISVILWLDPNLADKLATVKSFKSMLNQSEDN